jgi:DNA polymerase-2
VLLSGRWHIDRYNAMLFHDYGMDGILELARVTALPAQTAARVSPGSGISAMQMLTALRLGILVPWHKQQAERPKSALDLLRADQGGLVYQPTVGLHHDVAEIDFISMYPSIMVRFNISPETVGSSRAIAEAALELGAPSDPGTDPQPPGLVPQTLAPLLEKRLALKRRLASLPAWHPQRKTYQARASAHKWLLVTCFGYLGYKNARFGRIEAHEAVTAYGREALLRAKEAAEDLGFSVLHMYVDGLWVCRPGTSQPADLQPLLHEI